MNTRIEPELMRVWIEEGQEIGQRVKWPDPDILHIVYKGQTFVCPLRELELEIEAIRLERELERIRNRHG
jgi:hypothetical protein